MLDIQRESVNFANQELIKISQQLEQFNEYQNFWHKVQSLRDEYDPNDFKNISEQEILNPGIDRYVLYYTLSLVREELDKVAEYPKYKINTNLTTNNTHFNNN
jgi:hypothetical protein